MSRKGVLDGLVETEEYKSDNAEGGKAPAAANDNCGGDQEAIDALVAMSPLERDRQMKSCAEALGVKKSTLEAMVKERTAEAPVDDTKRGRAVQIGNIEPWPEPVKGHEVLDAAEKLFNRYLVMPPEQAASCALWSMHTHAARMRVYTPRLHIFSPARECGKTRLLEVLAEVVHASVSTVSMRAATLFRLLDTQPLTLMMDEVDRYLGDNDDLVGILNSGHRQGGVVHRCVEPDNEVREFHTFAPVAVCGIGQIDDTLESRSIPIRMQRKRVDQTVAEFSG